MKVVAATPPWLMPSMHAPRTHRARTAHAPCTCTRRHAPCKHQVRLGQFERALLQGRATIVGGYLILFGLQALVLAVLVVRPILDTL